MHQLSFRPFLVLCLCVFYASQGDGFRLSGYYVGCLEKSGFSTEALNYAPVIDVENLVPKLCFEACYRQRYKLAGLRHGNKCYCTNSTLDLSKMGDPDNCEFLCPGDNTKYCGGDLYRSVYATGITSSDNALQYTGRYTGCFELDSSSQDKAVFTDPKGLTPKACYETCYKDGFPYAGLRFGDACHCFFNTNPDSHKMADESACDFNCPGNFDQRCGGTFHQNVYATGLTASGFQPPVYYIGCFHKDAFPRGADNFYSFVDDKNLTPKLCAELCFWNGFKIARLQHGEKCTCSNSAMNMTKRSDDSDCNFTCPSDREMVCGGTLHLSVYATGLSDIPATGRLIGCFSETTNATGKTIQYLSDFREDLYETSSPETCMNLCYQMGFSFAGLKAGYLCLCGNSRPGENERKPESDCDRPCAGNATERCGGQLRLHVYKTPQSEKPEASVVSEMWESEELPTAPDVGYCPASETLYNGKNACKGSVIFFEESAPFNEKRWTTEMKIAFTPDYEFTVYDTKLENLFVEDGAMNIRPTVLDQDFVENGNIEFDESRCTGVKSNGECSRKTVHMILPPIQSSRITTKQTFKFQYGIVEVLAKLPIGDWITSEIALMPADSTYGPVYNSGKIRFLSRGNSVLKNLAGQNIGYQRVEGSVLVGYGQNIKSKAVPFDQSNGWRDQFHNFTIIWRPDDIVFLVDGKEMPGIMQKANSTTKLVDTFGLSSSKIKVWSAGTQLAPFDQPFYINIGVSAGGVRDFDDDLDSTTPKPWNNTDPRAMWKFWLARNSWKPSWKDDSTSLVIKSVKITAL